MVRSVCITQHALPRALQFSINDTPYALPGNAAKETLATHFFEKKIMIGGLPIDVWKKHICVHLQWPEKLVLRGVCVRFGKDVVDMNSVLEDVFHLLSDMIKITHLWNAVGFKATQSLCRQQKTVIERVAFELEDRGGLYHFWLIKMSNKRRKSLRCARELAEFLANRRLYKPYATLRDIVQCLENVFGAAFVRYMFQAGFIENTPSTRKRLKI